MFFKCHLMQINDFFFQDKHKEKSKDKEKKHEKEDRKHGREERKQSKEDKKLDKEEKRKEKGKMKDKAEKASCVEVKNEPMSEDDDTPLVNELNLIARSS